MWGEGKARQKSLQALFHSGKELGSLSDTKYTVHSFRWEVGRLPSGNPQYFERQQIVSYKLKNQNARSKHEARINFFPCFLFFLQYGGKGSTGLLAEGKDASVGEQVMPRILCYGSAAVWEGQGIICSQSEHGII